VLSAHGQDRVLVKLLAPEALDDLDHVAHNCLARSTAGERMREVKTSRVRASIEATAFDLWGSEGTA
jgi:hypothetical protein